MKGTKVAAGVHDQQPRSLRPVVILLVGALVFGPGLRGLPLARVNGNASVRAFPKVLEGGAMDGKKSSPVQHTVQTASGRISYTEQGSGLVALFVHGVLLNGYL